MWLQRRCCEHISQTYLPAREVLCPQGCLQPVTEGLVQAAAYVRHQHTCIQALSALLHHLQAAAWDVSGRVAPA